MSNLEVYCVLHFQNKNVFEEMGKLGQILDKKDFATNGYMVDEKCNPKSIAKAAVRKEKVVVVASQWEGEMEVAQEEEKE